MPGVPDFRTLAEIPLFAELADVQLMSLNERLRKRVFPAGTNIITVETPGEVVYVILSGTVKIKVDQLNGTETIIAILGKGDTVGELSVLDGISRSADVVTQEESTLLWMDRSSFHELLASAPAVKDNLIQILTRRQRLSTEQIQALCTLDVRGIVARQIVVFAERYGVKTPEGIYIPIRLTQSDIAGLVGASRERVNQVVVSLGPRNEKLISIDASYHITVLDIDKLRKIVEER